MCETCSKQTQIECLDCSYTFSFTHKKVTPASQALIAEGVVCQDCGSTNLRVAQP